MNKVIFSGNITKDLELKKAQNGKSWLDFSIAINEGKTADGREIVTYPNLRAFDKTADLIAQYCAKGSKVIAECKFRVDVRDTAGGRVYYNYFVVDRIEFVNPKNNNQEFNDRAKGYPQQDYSSQNSNNGYSGYADVKTDDLPFF